MLNKFLKASFQLKLFIITVITFTLIILLSTLIPYLRLALSHILQHFH